MFNLNVTPDMKVFSQELNGDWKCMPRAIPPELEGGYRVDTAPPTEFTNQELKLIMDTYGRLKKIQKPVYINSTSVKMYDLLAVEEDEKLTEDVRSIARTAVMEKTGDLWTMFGNPERKPVTVELVQLKMLDMTEGYHMVIHTDDLHSKSLNFNRHLTAGQSTAFPKPDSELALAYHIVRNLDLDEQELAESENPKSLRLRDTTLREAVSRIAIPTPDHMVDMKSRFVQPGGSSTFVSCVFHTVPVPGSTSTEKEPVKRPHSNRLLLFHSFIVKGTRMAARNLDYQYTPSILCDMVHGKNSKQSAHSIAIWKSRFDLDQTKFYQN
jgi:hypothetical protein